MTDSTESAKVRTIRENPTVAQINLRGDPKDSAFLAAAFGSLQVSLPLEANTWNGGSSCAALWLGPDEWLITAEGRQSEDIIERLERAMAGLHHAVTDISAARVAVDIAGASARQVLTKGCSLPLHAEAFGAGRCAQTLVAKAQVVMQHLGPSVGFRLFVHRSFAAYLITWLNDADAECTAARHLDSDYIAARLG